MARARRAAEEVGGAVPRLVGLPNVPVWRGKAIRQRLDGERLRLLYPHRLTRVPVQGEKDLGAPTQPVTQAGVLAHVAVETRRRGGRLGGVEVGWFTKLLVRLEQEESDPRRADALLAPREVVPAADGEGPAQARAVGLI